MTSVSQDEDAAAAAALIHLELLTQVDMTLNSHTSFKPFCVKIGWV